MVPFKPIVDTDILTEKILKGIQKSFDKLVIEKAKNDDYLYFEKDGHIIKIKAKDILKGETI
jgi:hypothetical protein